MQRSTIIRVLVIIFALISVTVFISFRSMQTDTSLAQVKHHPLQEAHPDQWATFSRWVQHPFGTTETETVDNINTTKDAKAGVGVDLSDLQSISMEKQRTPSQTKSPGRSITSSATVINNATVAASIDPQRYPVPLVRPKESAFDSAHSLLPHIRFKPTHDYHPHTAMSTTTEFFRMQELARLQSQRDSSAPNTTISKVDVVTDALKAPTKHEATSKPSGNQAGSSSKGTLLPRYEHYTDNHLLSATQCRNQTTCITPVLQLHRSYNVYYCKRVSYGVRFYFLVKEGLLLHPKITLVDTMEAADVIVYLPESAAWKKSECNDPKQRHKLLLLDEGDGPQLFSLPKPSPGMKPSEKEHFLMYFKRSYVRRENGRFRGYMNYVSAQTQPIPVLPLFYPVATAYLRHPYRPFAERDLEITCSLRGSDWDPTRQRIKEWTEEYVRARHIPVDRVRVGEINQASRTVVSNTYFDAMYRAKIVVTVNPSHWEGDFRLAEALASGALVFVDELFVPRPSMPLHDRHIVYYNNNDKAAFFALLDKYRAGFGGGDGAKVQQKAADEDTRNVHFLRGDTTSVKSSNSKQKQHLRQQQAQSSARLRRRRLQTLIAESEAGARLPTSQRVAMTGYLHANRFLRCENLIDYVFRSLHIQELETAQRGKNSAFPLERLVLNQTYASGPVHGYNADHGFALRMQGVHPLVISEEGGGEDANKVVAPGSAMASTLALAAETMAGDL